MDVFIVTSLIEPPLLHLPYPSVTQAQAEIAASNDGSLPLEPYQLISQYTLEPLLRSLAEQLPSVTVRYGCEFLSFTQDAGRRFAPRSATATARRRHQRATISSAATAARARCAGSSASRCKAKPTCCNCGRRCFAATTCYERIPIGKGRHYHVADDRRPS